MNQFKFCFIMYLYVLSIRLLDYAHFGFHIYVIIKRYILNKIMHIILSLVYSKAINSSDSA